MFLAVDPPLSSHFLPHSLLYLFEVQLQPFLFTILLLRKLGTKRGRGLHRMMGPYVTVLDFYSSVPTTTPSSRSNHYCFHPSLCSAFGSYLSWSSSLPCIFHSFFHSWHSFSDWVNSAPRGCANRVFSTIHRLDWFTPLFLPSSNLQVQCGSTVAFIWLQR